MFAPFDALKGFHEALEKKEQVAVPRPVLSEDQLALLDDTFHHIHCQDSLALLWYHNGHYEKTTGIVTDFSVQSRSLTIACQSISFDDILEASIL